VDPTPITIPSILFTKVVVKEKTANIRSEAKAEAAVLINRKKGSGIRSCERKTRVVPGYGPMDLNKLVGFFAKSVTRQVRK